MKSLRFIEKLFDFVLIFLLVSSFSVAVVLYLLQVGLRFTHHAIFWIDPLVQYLFVLASLLGASYAVKFYENIKIELFSKLSENKIVRFLINLVAALLSLVFIYIFTLRLLEEYHNPEKTDFGVSKWLLELPYLFLFLSSSFYYFLNLFVDQSRENAS